MIFVISVHCDGTESLNSPSWKARDVLSSLVKIKDADDLALQGT